MCYSPGFNLLTGYILIMTDTLEYLLTFRKCSSLDSLEKVYDKLNYSIEMKYRNEQYVPRLPTTVALSWLPVNCSIWARCRKRCGRRCFNSVKLRAATVLSLLL